MAQRVAIIGAGISGLVAAKECLEEGLQPTVFEARAGIGGQWRYEEPHSVTGETFSSVYNGVISNSSAQRSHFSDFPMDPAKYPDYPSHTDYLTYIMDYASHFGLNAYIRLNTEVLSCDKQEDSKWMVTTTDNEELYDALFICTGKESIPYAPAIAGFDRFEGRIIHSHVYRQPESYEGKRVAVVGFGPSAVDIATEVSAVAESCHLITQRGGWVLPRYVNGKVVESLQTRLLEYLMPRAMLSWSYERAHRAVMGETPDALKPDHGILEANAVVSNEFLTHVRSGRITAHRATIERFSETQIILSNQEALEVDEVILCTGYSVTAPVISEDTYRGSEPNSVRLYRSINPPAHHNLFFMGLVEFLGPIHPTVELQARWAVARLTDRITLPSVEKMERSIDRCHRDQCHQFVHSRRHTIAVPALAYMETLAADLGVMPSLRKLSRKYVFSRTPSTGLSLVNFYYNGMITAAPYRLFGHGRKAGLAEATMVRMAQNGETLSEREDLLLMADKATWNVDDSA